MNISSKVRPGLIALGLMSLGASSPAQGITNGLSSLLLGNSISRSATPGIDPNLRANYHIDRSDQDAFTERLRTKIQRSDNSVWGEGPVEISFMAPLGLPSARNELVRNFTEQQISKLEIYIDGQKIPYVEKPKKDSVNFWTLDVDPMTTQDQVAIRIPSPGGNRTPTLEILLEGTLIYSTLKPGAADNSYRFNLPPKMAAVGLEMNEEGYKVDTQRLSGQLSSLGLAPSSPFRVSDVLGQFAEFFSTNATYDKTRSNQTSDVNAFFGDKNLRVGNCHTLNTPSLLGLRSLGITTFYPSGRVLGTSLGHATNYVYDSQLGDAFIANFSGISAGRYSGSMVESLNAGRPRNLIYFEIDRTYINTYGIKGIDGEPEPAPVSMGTSGCGYLTVSQDGKRVNTSFPESVPGASSVKKLNTTDPHFVVFNSEGINFNSTLIARRGNTTNGGTQQVSGQGGVGGLESSLKSDSPFADLAAPTLGSIGLAANR